MVSKAFLRRASFLLIMTAMSGCTVTTTNGEPGGGVPDTCSQNSGVVGCVAGQGYSCTGVDSPDEGDSALSCSVGTPSNGGQTLYCCIDTTSVTSGCTADSTIVGCAGSSIGFSCTGSAEPQDGSSSLVCSTGTVSGSETLFCCASYTASAGTCAQDSTVAGCAGSSIGFSCSGSDTPMAVNPSLACSQGTAGGAGTAYCCTSGGGSTTPPPTAACSSDGAVSCTAPATGYSCTGGVTPDPATLTCGQGTPEADGTTLAYCCNAASAAPACLADTTVTGCPGDSTGYTCTGGANPETATLLCGMPMAEASGSSSYCCSTN